MLVSRLSLIVLAMTALTPTAMAASATAEPASPAPGSRVLLVYTADAGLADIRVMDSVSCTIEGPEAVECGAASELVVASLSGGPRTYAFEITAPPTAGAYTARFTRASLVSTATADAAAEATFFVAAPPVGPSAIQPDLLSPGSTEADPSEERPDGGRWLLSLFMASGATSAAVVLARRPGGL